MKCTKDNLSRKKKTVLVGAVFLLFLTPVIVFKIATATESIPVAMIEGCQENTLKKSICTIRVILDDISTTYDHVGGGGISKIKQDTTNSFTVSISQEERVDLITYEVGNGSDGEIIILNRTTTIKTQGR